MSWSSLAQTILQSNKAKGRVRCYIDCANWGYGDNIIEVTDRILDFGEITRASTAIEREYSTCQAIIRFRNDDAYFTPNMMGSSRDQITNIWQVPIEGEVSPYLCKLYIDIEIDIAGYWESERYFKGMIKELSFSDEGGPACEITACNEVIDALDKTLTLSDGESDST